MGKNDEAAGFEGKVGDAVPLSTKMFGMVEKTYDEFGMSSNLKIAAASVAWPFVVGFAVGGPLGAGFVGIANLIGANMLGQAGVALGFATAGVAAFICEKTKPLSCPLIEAGLSGLSGLRSRLSKMQASSTPEVRQTAGASPA